LHGPQGASQAARRLQFPEPEQLEHSRTLYFIDNLDQGALGKLLRPFGLGPIRVAAASPIPGSYWGEPEAGLIGNHLYVRGDTPVHSALHEACHYVCMDGARRADLHTDAGGTTAEEDAVCWLQIALSDHLAGIGRAAMFRDMDSWGYSFRLGSARAWFEQDADDARDWLLAHGLINRAGSPTWRLRK
jgi:hypothetical protein